MLSAFILSVHSYSALLLAEQPIHQRYIRPGPLVLRSCPCNFLTPTTDRDRTVLRRSEPSSRATLIGDECLCTQRLERYVTRAQVFITEYVNYKAKEAGHSRPFFTSRIHKGQDKEFMFFGVVHKIYRPFEEEWERKMDMVTAVMIGVKINMMIIPNTKSSCLPEASFGRPNTVTPNHAAAIPRRIQTIPKIFLIPSILYKNLECIQ